MKPLGRFSSRSWTARKPKTLVKYEVFVRFQWSAKAAMSQRLGARLVTLLGVGRLSWELSEPV